ncbi:efflux transporter outer membrane subunit [Pseudomonas vanderleydeniana]|uniref:Efflux transporter outer membrane subunit n=1 Tax=Pseudomonas vanderleydeniana TaxID=2745495 RepID=A0A9E6PIR8_9PSED|nr:efflux transporter outer membrane subunit [Pseudomonas vanderleydeniana]QXI26866.1 efflux transporter outer membrane subunit [Pseudomonas vanderleydeniana]
MKPQLSLLTVCLLLNACSGPASNPDSGLAPPAAWQFAQRQAMQQDNRQWWRQFGSPELDQLIEQARRDSHDIAAAAARVRQARASAVIAGAPLLPQLDLNLDASRSKLLHGTADSDNNSKSFGAGLTATYEVDFWGGLAATRDSALQSLRASEFDQATVELTLLGSVADQYARTLSAREQQHIAELNLVNAQSVLKLVQTRYDSGSATALELAQQKSLVAAQQRQLPLIQQQAGESLISLAALLGQPVQALQIGSRPFSSLSWPRIDAGLPSELLSRRPDIARAEAQLAAAQADVKVARAAMLPKLTLSAQLASESSEASKALRTPFYNLTAGLVAPIFNNGRLRAGRDKATAREEELLETYRGAIINGFADVEKALNSIERLDQQRQWQEEELRQAKAAFELSQSRYRAGAEDLLTVLETQRTLYAAEDLNVQLRLSRLQASIALYKALGGGWSER